LLSGKLELVVLGSGSKGNSTLVRTPNTALLLDAGLSARQIALRLRDVGFDAQDLDGILLTHEHRDHVGGVRVLAERTGTPVLANAATLEAAADFLGKAERRPFITGWPFTCGDFAITSFPVSHDSAEPVGYLLEAEGVAAGYATDLGHLTTEVASRICGSHVVVLEANHDVEMLWAGPYPWRTKERIDSKVGHLDNASGAEALAAILGPSTSHLVLAHLSENNNERQLVRDQFSDALAAVGRTDVQLTVTSQDRPSAPVRL
jgi:phosphoribosyl 1,2-cyclic phosphodiesterase